jgi:hypothetical protein
VGSSCQLRPVDPQNDGYWFGPGSRTKYRMLRERSDLRLPHLRHRRTGGDSRGRTRRTRGTLRHLGSRPSLTRSFDRTSSGRLMIRVWRCKARGPGRFHVAASLQTASARSGNQAQPRRTWFMELRQRGARSAVAEGLPTGNDQSRTQSGNRTNEARRTYRERSESLPGRGRSQAPGSGPILEVRHGHHFVCRTRRVRRDL